MSTVSLIPGTTLMRDALAHATRTLQAGSVSEPVRKAEYLVSEAAGCPRLALSLEAETLLPESAMRVVEEQLQRLLAGDPLQYALGFTEFMGCVIKTDRRALIPRPETECLVQAVLDCEPVWMSEHPSIADVGTGSGCIPIVLALERAGGTYTATDASSDALSLARENAAAHGVADSIRFLNADLLGAPCAGSLDVVVSNPPYIASTEIDRLPREIRDAEPRVALDGGANGLSVLARLVKQAALALRPGGRFFSEIGASQGLPVMHRLEQAGFRQVHLLPDLAGRARIATGVMP